MCILLGRFAVCSSPSLEFYSKCIHMAPELRVSIIRILLAIAETFAFIGGIEYEAGKLPSKGQGGFVGEQDPSELRAGERAEPKIEEPQETHGFLRVC